jgi:hypothetical protein
MYKIRKENERKKERRSGRNRVTVNWVKESWFRFFYM